MTVQELYEYAWAGSICYGKSCSDCQKIVYGEKRHCPMSGPVMTELSERVKRLLEIKVQKDPTAEITDDDLLTIIDELTQ